MLFVATQFAYYSASPIALMIVSAVILLFLLEIDHVERSTYNLLSGFSKIGKTVEMRTEIMMRNLLSRRLGRIIDKNFWVTQYKQ